MVPKEWLKTVVLVGDLSLSVLVVSNLVLLFYFHKNRSSDTPSLYDAIKSWPQETKDRILLVGKYFLCGFLTLLFCSTIACKSVSVQNFIKTHYILTTISTTIGLFLSMVFVHNFSYNEHYRAKLFFFIMHCILTTPTVCTLGSEICLIAGLCTAVLMALLIFTALSADEDFHRSLVSPLTKMNSVVIVASIFITIIGTPKSGIEIFFLCLNIHLGFFFFAGMFIVNIQLLLSDCKTEEEKFDPIYIAAVMEISSLNLFLRMATLVTIRMALLNSDENKKKGENKKKVKKE